VVRDGRRNRTNETWRHSQPITNQLLSVADLADVIGDFAVADDVQGILVCVIVALGELEGFLVTQLKTRRTTSVKC